MHTLIPYAMAPGPRCRDALTRLRLPHLEQLLRLLVVEVTDHGTTTDLSPLHERAIARASGLRAGDGLMPWAALDAQRLGLTTLHGEDGWAWITPCHWSVHADHVAMADPMQLALTTKEYEVLHHAMQPYFAGDGITLFASDLGHHPVRWLAHGAVLRDLPTASLNRVTGFTVDRWFPRQAQANTLRKLQNEMQMLLYRHPLNDARANYKLPAVNSFWVSGTGTPDHRAGAIPSAPLKLEDGLRAPALKDDPSGWASAWHAIDNHALAHAVAEIDKGQPVRITLTGEAQTVTLSQRPDALWQRLKLRYTAGTATTILGTL